MAFFREREMMRVMALRSAGLYVLACDVVREGDDIADVMDAVHGERRRTLLHTLFSSRSNKQRTSISKQSDEDNACDAIPNPTLQPTSSVGTSKPSTRTTRCPPRTYVENLGML